MTWWEISLYTGTVLYMLALASIIFRMILENRSPVRTLAWIVVLLTIPVAGDRKSVV